jgi:hypothetical protein
MSQHKMFVAVAVWFAAAGGAYAAAFQNGSFESPAITVASGLSSAFGTDPLATMPGWTATTNGSGASENFLYGLSTSGYSDGVSAGSQAVLLNGDGSVTTTLAQTFGTISGGKYTVEFDLGIQSSAAGGTTAPVSVQASGSATDNYTVTAVGAANTIHPFTTESYLFTATSNSTTLTFTQVGGGVDSPLLDNVRVTPEPSSIVLGGFGALGLFIAARRRRKA